MELQRIIPYMTSNDPLPDELRPLLLEYLDHLPTKIDVFGDQVQYTQLRAPLSAVRLAPMEIIAKIMEFALRDDMPLDRNSRSWFTQLRGVCSLWRRTAFSTPALWRGLRVSDDSSEGMDSEMLMFNIFRWFSRAGAQKQHLVLAPSHGINPSDAVLCLRSLPRLAHYEVSLAKSDSDFFTALASSENSNQLSHLVLQLTDAEWNLNTPGRLDEIFPGLRYLSLRYLGDGPALRVTHGQLRSLRLYNAIIRPISSLSHYLCEMPSLEELYTAFCCINHRSNDIKEESIMHPSLKHIAIIMGRSPLREFQNSVFSFRLPRCPRLERVTLMTPANYTTLHQPIRYLPLVVSGCHPGTLTIDLSYMAPRKTPQIFSQIHGNYQLNVADLFENKSVVAGLAKLVSPPPRVVSRLPPRQFDQTYWRHWAEPFTMFKDKLRGTKMYASTPAGHGGAVQDTVSFLKDLGFDFAFLPQCDLEEMMGTSWSREDIALAGGWDEER
ncbi:hypothetical protein BKA70DRAFT_1360280 [Coprinopsis sp. MPI-PUGE-AT-0042]|nr:hypothetical protein BKA70DRAFT_1360280 [Coprinopsis sp. MPI-PUGE-AT-0042]